MPIDVVLSYNNGTETLRLPVPPTSYDLQTGMAHSTVNVHNLGEVLVMGKRKLNSITLESYFPIQDDGLCVYKDFPPPVTFVNTLNRWKESGKPLRLLITARGLSLNQVMAIEEFAYGHRPGPLDVYFTLTLREYRFVTAQQAASAPAITASANSASAARTSTKTPPKTYTVKKGDTGFLIAKRVYGDGSRWPEIKKKNGITDDRKLQIGQVLKI
ncbi:LysM domain-containing protein [Paenibacillus sp. RUD330]|nr:LysM domain-containing protein [Paenibacillus sp. RUD330]ASS64681.1 LysM peptidoglycan-binding domain-containing protein [Paenibacillus sp. RUD330]